MDRFIDGQGGNLCQHRIFLKSNMDRFIAVTDGKIKFFAKDFKIQYG